MAEILFVLVITGWLAGWLMLCRVTLIQQRDTPHVTTRFSVLIPARNEAHNLPRLLKSLEAQNPPPEEIIVADDGSTDGTGEIARKMGASVIVVPTLEKGWTGKTWALRHAALSAQHESLFLLDADTWMQPHSLQAIRSAWEELKKPGVISILPFHETTSWFEGFSIFFNLLMAAGAGGFGIFGKPKLFGQALVIEREAFLKLGSDKDVHGKVLENFSMSDKLNEEGFLIQCFSGKHSLSFRMFPEGLRSLIEGWSKAFARGAAGTTIPVLLTTILWMFGIGSVAVLLALSLTLKNLSLPTNFVIAAYGIFVAQIGFLASRFGRFPLWSYLLFPITFVAYQLIFLKSILIASGLSKARWRGRELS